MKSIVEFGAIAYANSLAKVLIQDRKVATEEEALPETGHSPTSTCGPKRQFANSSFRRQSGNSRRWSRRLKADIRLGHLGAWAGDRSAAKAFDQIMPE